MTDSFKTRNTIRRSVSPPEDELVGSSELLRRDSCP